MTELYVVFYENRDKDEYEFVRAHSCTEAIHLRRAFKPVVGVFEASQFVPSADTMDDIWNRAKEERIADPRREDCCDFHRNGGLLDAKCRGGK